MKKRKQIKKMMTVFMALIMIVTMIPVISKPITAEAATTDDVCLGTTFISYPERPSSADDPWRGSYVWFGQYENMPVKYRVLSPSNSKYGKWAMLLDADSPVYEVSASSMNYSETNPFNWATSSVKSGLNGSAFLNKDGVFTTAEKNAIITSRVDGYELRYNSSRQYDGYVTQEVKSLFGNYIGLNGERIFLLDAEDLQNRSYGYYNLFNNSMARKKNGTNWLLRSTCVKSQQGHGTTQTLGNPGSIFTNSTYNIYGGFGSFLPDSGAVFSICPAFNVDLEKIIFTKKVSGTVGLADAEYKFTLEDPYLGITVNGNCTEENGKVVIPFAKYGTNKSKSNRVTIFITGYEYSAASPTSMMYYGSLTGGASNAGDGYFTLPSQFKPEDWGSKYHVYMMAETENGNHYSDYGSTPIELAKPEHIHSIKSHSKKAATCTEDGNKAYFECTGCGKFYEDKNGSKEIKDHDSVVIKAAGHQWGEWKVTDPTPEKDGKKVRTCSVCGTKETVKLPAVKVIDITLKNKASGVQISWDKVGTAAKYRVYRKGEGQASWESLGTTTSLSYTDKKAEFSATYLYSVRAMNSSGSCITKNGSGESIKHLISAPKVTVSNIEEGIEVNWKTVTGAAKYRIFTKDENGNWKKLANVGKVNTFVDKKAQQGKSYTYSVLGIDSAGHFMNDHEKEATIVRNYAVISIDGVCTNEGVELNWNQYPGAERYRVYRKTSSGSWSKIATTYSLFYIDNDAVVNADNTYAVVALGTDGKAMTEYGKGKTIKFVVSPTEVYASSQNSGVRLEWSPVFKASKYKVYRKTKSTDWVKVGSSTGLSYIDKSAESGKTYFYSVIALDASGKAINDYRDDVKIKYVKPVSEDAEVLEAPVCVEIEDEEITEEIIEEEITEEDSEEETSVEDSEEETSEEDSEEEISEEDSEEEISEEDNEDSEESASEDETATETQDAADEDNGETISEDAAAVEVTDAAPIDEGSEDAVING